MNICKYLSPEGARASLTGSAGITLKFSLPQDYNDPFELYLEPGDFDEASDRAYFDFYLGSLAQFPVSCFSHTPDSVVMWAHYAQDRKGICVVFDEDALCDSFDRVVVDDVTYVDTFPSEYLSSINYAKTTGKARHMKFALSEAYSTAYFTKWNGWSYEKERRLVVNRSDIRESSGLLLGDIEPKALRAILVGSDIDADLLDISVRRGRELDIPVRQLRCSRRVSKPLFLDLATNTLHAWNSESFVEWGRACTNCNGPIVASDEDSSATCAWCRLSHSEKRDAAINNLLGATWTLGIEAPSISFSGVSVKGRKAAIPDESFKPHVNIAEPRPPITE